LTALLVTLFFSRNGDVTGCAAHTAKRKSVGLLKVRSHKAKVVL
jgi:hypothetical protein